MSGQADVIFPLAGKRVFVAGHRGMVGSAVERALRALGDCEVLTAGRDVMDLRNQASVEAWFQTHRPDAVVLAAAKVGGILANDTFPADFIYENLMIEANVIHAAHRADVAKLLFLGSSCIYPKFAEQPLKEEALLTGPLEPTNEWYAIAKIAGIKLCQAYRKQYGRDFISAMPTNLYGPNDNYDLNSSHVLPALLRKAHEARLAGTPSMTLWGSGTPRREFMHCDDLADALVYMLERYSDAPHLNVGVGYDVEIRELADIIKGVVGYQGALEYDRTKPDGTPRKLMDSARLLALGWAPKIGLAEGVAHAYDWFLTHKAQASAA
jgi:GDP-L-fucose synthase